MEMEEEAAVHRRPQQTAGEKSGLSPYRRELRTRRIESEDPQDGIGPEALEAAGVYSLLEWLP